MSPEAVAIVGVGVALLAVLVPLMLSIGRRIDRIEDRLQELARDLRALAERVARIEGAVCGPWRPPEPDPAGEKPA